MGWHCPTCTCPLWDFWQLAVAAYLVATIDPQHPSDAVGDF
jgi:hypothetical protein